MNESLLNDFENFMDRLKPFVLQVAKRIDINAVVLEALNVAFALPIELQFKTMMKYATRHETLLGSKDKEGAQKLLAGFLPNHHQLLKPEEIEKGFDFGEVLLLIKAGYEQEK